LENQGIIIKTELINLTERDIDYITENLISSFIDSEVKTATGELIINEKKTRHILQFEINDNDTSYTYSKEKIE